MRVVLATYDSRGGVEPLVGLALALRSETRARAAAVSGTIRTDGAAVAARLLLNEVSGREPPPSAR
ncbi:hypothetical protein [Mycobacterium saskatchewanense]|uniref:Uncharacterized protein n=1 Tax=Mycobacterium saskatchewanense TaxID=220927 RepID=A0AAJ3NPN3_9MYCO|nr:hypothetical protein [Mycobacterium saskatchewanense]ORW70735.1 hypothetical protein AWC23_15965 [Mycobacterium saskatchewanense]